MKIIVEEWSESMARSEQDSKNEFKRKVASGEWEKEKHLFFPTDEELQFIFGDNWKEEKARMKKESL
jgi:hypothetical protein